jgi:PknH-like extracellular domain
MTGSRAVMTVLCAAALAVTGCARTVGGETLAAETPNHTTVTMTTSRPQNTVPVAVLEGLLLTRQQLVALVSGANLALVGTANSTSDASKLVDDRACLGFGSVGDVTIYSNSGYVGMRGNQFSTPNAVQADVTQLVTSFTASADAQALVQRARQDWQGCANRRYGFHSSNGNHSYFDTQDLRGSGSRIEVSMRQEEDPRWGCSHAMTVQNNVVIEGRVCLLNKDTAAAVNNLLDQVVAKIPQ